jgi:transcriptional repressor NrdR
MMCPHCGYKDSKVTDSRSVAAGVRRRRQCLKCDQRFSTYESVQTTSLLIVKKGDVREEFNRQKLASGITKACEKRPMPAGTVEKLIDEIEGRIHRLGRGEVTSSEVGEMVMERLRKLDHIAYIRFASVYREFADIGSLKEEVDTLVNGGDDNMHLPGQLPLISDEQLAVVVKRNSLNRLRGNYA